MLKLTLHIRMAMCDGKPVQPTAWVDGHVAAANRILTPHGIKLVALQNTFTPKRCELVTRAHRDALAAYTPLGQVNVLVVRRAQDLDTPTYDLMGVHWRAPTGALHAALQNGSPPRRAGGTRWVILTARARPPVLAHELCHYLGLRHDPAGGNLMTPGPSDPSWSGPGRKPAPWKPLLTRSQALRVRAAVSRLIRSGVAR